MTGKLDAHVVAQALIPTLYSACGDGCDAFDAEYVGAAFGQAVDEVYGVLGDGQAVLFAVFGVLWRDVPFQLGGREVLPFGKGSFSLAGSVEQLGHEEDVPRGGLLVDGGGQVVGVESCWELIAYVATK